MLSLTAKTRWNDHADAELFPNSTKGGTYGRCASSLAESGNHALFGVRKHGAATALILFIEQDAERIASRIQLCKNWTKSHTPHECVDHIKAIESRSKSFPDPLVQVSKKKTWVTVTSQVARKVSYIITLSQKDCSCGVPKMSQKPCWHEVSACRVLKRDPLSLFGSCFKTETWNRQYAGLKGVKPIPMNCVANKTLGDLKMPIFGKIPKGRAADRKRKRSMQDILEDHMKKVKFESVKEVKSEADM